ncbi:MBL fold metallo-hydrolase [Gulosibacter hominis]|uniref:MBL fold metallo-hydrolase n=1 Tax=Gulosibacter hominis TaxID=2770504 RepID=UPI001919261C|nr:MBL fold metallo-hydrolase [Gulosibacter hominis]
MATSERAADASSHRDDASFAVAPGVLRIRANNPSQMTLSGTNSYLIDGRILIDPGPDLEPHVDALARWPIETVLISHRHRDHTGAFDALVARTGARAFAALDEYCRDAATLRGGERIETESGAVEVLATPGHTTDSLSFTLVRDGADRGLVFTADTILGGITTMLDFPDGTLGDYLATLDRLVATGENLPLQICPGHGPTLPDLASEAQRLRGHRMRRLEQVATLRDACGDDAGRIARRLYADAPEQVLSVAESMVRANLAHLQTGDR